MQIRKVMTSYVASLKLTANNESRRSQEILQGRSSNFRHVHHKRNKMTPVVLLSRQHPCF